jgi:hypothetical protein
MKIIIASVTKFSLTGARVVKADIELATGEGTATLVSQGNLNHTITVDVPESKIDTVTALFRVWRWTISEPQPKDPN